MELLAAGRAFLDGLERALQPQAPQPGEPKPPAEAIVERDDKTGRTYLKLPMPSRETVEKIAQVLQVFIGGK